MDGMVIKEGELDKLKGGVWKRRYCELVQTTDKRPYLVYRQKKGKRVLWRVELAGAKVRQDTHDVNGRNGPWKPLPLLCILYKAHC